MKNYIELANVTMSTQWHGNKISKEELFKLLSEAASTLTDLDKVKKALFYGKPYEALYASIDQCGSAVEDLDDLPIAVAPHGPVSDGIKIIHGIIGSATEAGEKLEALIKVLTTGEPLDLVNLLEEIGDGFWYDAAVCRVAGTDFSAVQATNIAKLEKRFPDGFTSYHAENRNLEGEREVLEGGVHNANHRNYDRCIEAPEGWQCKRLAGHEGPCAADPVAPAKPEYGFTRAQLQTNPFTGTTQLVGLSNRPSTKPGAPPHDPSIWRETRSSRVINIDIANNLVETLNSVYKVDNWA